MFLNQLLKTYVWIKRKLIKKELINEKFQAEIINFLNIKKLFQEKMVHAESSIQEQSDTKKHLSFNNYKYILKSNKR
jgi:hypothetical protein